MTTAAIDIGSNSVRLLVVDDDGTELARATEVTALGTGLERTGSFDADAYTATIEVITRYSATIADLGVDLVRAVATSASRDAGNGPALVADVERVLGTMPTIIDGAREANLAFAGATRGLGGGGTKLVVDIGGGSTEFVYGFDTPSYAVSVDMGSVRLTDRCIDTRPALPDQMVDARAEVDAAFAPVAVCDSPEIAIGIAGTFTSLSAMALDLEVYDSDRVHGSHLTLDVVRELTGWLATLSLSETAAIPSLDPARARVILAGAVVAERALVHCGLESVTVSERGLLNGLVLDVE